MALAGNITARAPYSANRSKKCRPEAAKRSENLLAWGQEAEAEKRCWEPKGGVVCNVIMW